MLKKLGIYQVVELLVELKIASAIVLKKMR